MTSDGVPVYIPTGRKPRLVLALLVSRAGQSVSIDALIAAVWGDRPPASARRNLQQYIQQLRAALGAEGLVRHGDGYSVVADDGVDAIRFRRLCAAGTAAFTAGDAALTSQNLRAGLDLWRGPAFTEFLDCPAVAEQAASLEQLRVDAVERWAQADLALGRHAGLVTELTELMREHPYREGLCARLMLALYRSGRQAEALQTFRRTRALLRDQLGIEPGPELQHLHAAILRGDEHPQPAAGPGHEAATGTAAGVPVPHELPPDVRGFTGRTEALRQLDAILPTSSPDVGAVVISAIAGMAGVGKTALAVHWAHRVADRFPDGQLHLNLRGYASDAPVRPIEALATLLRALGVAPEQIPAEVTEAAARYRSLTAGRRLLIVLDNVASAEQVRPLLPGTAGSLVLITSRDRLSGLVARDGARRLTLDVLDPGEADDLLRSLLGADRTAAEPAAVAELAAACAYLPLALRIAAAHLIDRPHHTIAECVAWLKSDDPTVALSVEGDEESAVGAAFTRSYVALPEPARIVFRRLGLIPLPEFSTPAVAALAGIAEDKAARILDTLEAAHLINQIQPGRYTVHDLLRRYAHTRAELEETDQDRGAAVSRIFDWYLGMATTAAEILLPEVLRLPSVDSFWTQRLRHRDKQAAMSWLEAERHNLVSGIRHAYRHGPRAYAWRLADAMRGYLDQRRHMTDWLTVARTALAASRVEGDLQAQAAALINLGHANFALSQYHRAADYVTRASVLAGRCGWTAGQAHALSNLGVVLADLGQAREATTQLSRALDLHEQLHQQGGRANAHNFLAVLAIQLGNLHDGISHAHNAVTLWEHMGAQSGQATGLATLGELHYHLSQLDHAQDHLMLALQHHRELGNRWGEADTLATLALLHCDAGHPDRGHECATMALDLARDIGDRYPETRSLIALAAACRALENPGTAVRLSQTATQLAQEICAPYLSCEATIDLAASHLSNVDWTAALDQAQRALDHARRATYRVLEGQALNLLAEVHLARGNTEQALKHATQALDCHRATGHQLGEAHAHTTLSRILRDTDLTVATKHTELTRNLYTKIGVPIRNVLPAQ